MISLMISGMLQVQPRASRLLWISSNVYSWNQISLPSQNIDALGLEHTKRYLAGRAPSMKKMRVDGGSSSDLFLIDNDTFLHFFYNDRLDIQRHIIILYNIDHSWCFSCRNMAFIPLPAGEWPKGKAYGESSRPLWNKQAASGSKSDNERAGQFENRKESSKDISSSTQPQDLLYQIYHCPVR